MNRVVPELDGFQVSSVFTGVNLYLLERKKLSNHLSLCRAPRKVLVNEIEQTFCNVFICFYLRPHAKYRQLCTPDEGT